jgi:hypothetical protein
VPQPKGADTLRERPFNTGTLRVFRFPFWGSRHTPTATLSSAHGVDAGEAVLFSATIRFDHYLLATGDKNSLCAVASTPACWSIALRLCGHVICLEQIVTRVVQHFGFGYVKDKIVPVRSCDTALRAAFGSGDAAAESNVLATLDGYINELRFLPIDLLV